MNNRKGKDMKNLKRIITVFMVAITLCTVCAPIAGAKYYEAPYTYVFEDGTTVEYNFDLDGNSYGFINGEKVDLLLPLECYKVTDPELLAELNADLETITNSGSSMARVAPPTNYYNFTVSSSTSLRSANTYTQSINYDNISNDVSTSFLNPYIQHNNIVLKTTNIKTKNLSLNKKINYSFWYYDVTSESWYVKTFTKNCTAGVPHGYIKNYDFVRFTFIKSSNIKSFNANIWTIRAE